MKLKHLLYTAGVLCLFAGNTYATPISYDAGTVYTTEQVVDSSNGANLHGMEVTACFLSGQCETILFDGSLGGATFGAAIGDGWQLSLFGDSFHNPFTFTADVAITLLHLNGAPGNTVFDVKDIMAGPSGTPGSQSGSFFEVDFFSDISPVSVLYSNQVWFHQTFYGDLYTSMTVHFDSAGVTGSMSFYADTDQATVVAVPLPATGFLLLAGLMALRLRRFN